MNKLLKAINQRPQDLKLAIVTEDKLPSTINLVEKSQIIDDWSIRFSIIGESHRVRIDYQGQFMMEEMLACITVPSENCQHYHGFDDLQAHDFEQAVYHVCVSMQRNRNPWQEAQNEISYSFPEINGIQALTKIQWHYTHSSVSWRTLHTYTDAGDILCVYSDSNYTFQAEGMNDE